MLEETSDPESGAVVSTIKMGAVSKFFTSIVLESLTQLKDNNKEMHFSFKILSILYTRSAEL